MKDKLIWNIAKYIFAIHFIIFGANKFIGFASFPPPTDEIAQLFMGAMFSSYLAKLVGMIEIIGGILLLIPKTTFLGLLLCLPIVANITAFHLFHDLPGNGISGGILLLIPKTTFLGLLLCLPIVVNITAFHLFHDLPGNGIWIITIVLALIISLGFQSEFANLISKNQKQ